MPDSSTSVRTSARPGTGHAPCLLGISLEDYFHVGAFRNLIARSYWPRFETRLEQLTNKALDLLDESGTRATFFTLGWVAENLPELVRRVVERGHEVANSGYSHQGVAELDREALREELQRGNNAIARATGLSPQGTRIPDWIREKQLWALDIVAALGYRYDASLRPLGTDCVAHPERRFPFDYAAPGHVVREFPVPTTRIGPFLLPFAGGNWLRQLPETMVVRAIERWLASPNVPFSLYFQLWELDPAQPRITAASWITSVRHYRNLGRTERLLRHLLARRTFVGYADYLGLTPVPSGMPESAVAPVRGLNVLPVDQSGRERRIAVTVVVPCFNEADTIPYLMRTLASVSLELRDRYDLSFLFVDDASHDATHRVLESIAADRSDAVVVRHAVNQGIAGAILTGIAAAQDEFVCSIDADCSYDPHQIGDLLRALEGGADLVTASPYHPDGRMRHVPRWRLFLSHTLSQLYSRRLNSGIHTYTSCFRAYRRSRFAGLALSYRGFLGIAELIVRALLGGLRVVEVPASLEGRLLGKSKLRVLPVIRGHLRILRELDQWRGAKAMRLTPVDAGVTQTAAAR
ncbi:MAG: glycosyltransferase [Gemmatimonadaceae bacterium]